MLSCEDLVPEKVTYFRDGRVTDGMSPWEDAAPLGHALKGGHRLLGFCAVPAAASAGQALTERIHFSNGIPVVAW